MAFGIPGDAVTAVMLGALTIHGIQSGPLFISQNPQLAYGIFAAYLLAHPIMVLIMLGSAARWMLRIVTVPKAALFPVVLVLCVIGAYALNNTMANVYVLLAFGVVGYAHGEVRLSARAVHPGRDPRRPDRDQPGALDHDRLEPVALRHAADLGAAPRRVGRCRSSLALWQHRRMQRKAAAGGEVEADF